MKKMTPEISKQLVDLTMSFGKMINNLSEKMIERENHLFKCRRKYSLDAMILTHSDDGNFFVYDYHNLENIEHYNINMIRRHLYKQLLTIGKTAIWIGIVVDSALADSPEEFDSLLSYGSGVIMYSQTQLFTKRYVYTTDENDKLVKNLNNPIRINLPRDVNELGNILPYSLHLS